MNLDLFLMQKVVQSLFQNDANASLMPLQTSPKKIKKESYDAYNEHKENGNEGEKKENNKDPRQVRLEKESVRLLK